MPGIQLDEIPEPARTAWASLRDQLRTILAENLAAIWAHGGSSTVGGPPHHGDLDTYVLLSRRPDQRVARQLEKAEEGVERRHGMESDAWYILADDAHDTDPPLHAWHDGRRDTAWAIHRAHWLAGRYLVLHGPEPEAIVMPPSWDELQRELDRELEHIERHVFEGDTDPYEATYAFLNGSRILHAVETRHVAVSKRAAGLWALQALPARWHASLQAALRWYDGQASAGETDLLATEMAPFVAFVRELLPYREDRPSDALPRWSGS